jgi:hypothetical protein
MMRRRGATRSSIETTFEITSLEMASFASRVLQIRHRRTSNAAPAFKTRHRTKGSKCGIAHLVSKCGMGRIVQVPCRPERSKRGVARLVQHAARLAAFKLRRSSGESSVRQAHAAC